MNLKSRYTKIILFFIPILISVALSIYSMTTQSIRLDESQSIWVATKPIITIIKFSAQDVHVPLYEIILHFWIQFFGTDITIVRIPSLLFHLLTLPILYLLAKAASNSKVAAFSVILFAISPFIIWYSSEARMYTLFILISCLNNLFFLKVWQSRGKSGKTGYLLFTILGFYVHYFFTFLIMTQIIFIGIKNIKKIYFNRALTYLDFKMPLIFLSLLFGAFISFIPWIMYFIKSGLASNTQPLIPEPSIYDIFQTFSIFLFGFQDQTIQTILVSLWPIFTLVLFFIFTQKKRVNFKSMDYFALATFLPIIIVFSLSFIKSIFLSRYLIFVTPPLFILISWLLSNYSSKISLYLITFLVIIMLGSLFYQDISINTPVKENYKGVSGYLDKTATAKDIVVVSAPFTVYPIEYYYNGNARIDTLPHWDRYTQTSISPFSVSTLQSQVAAYKSEYDNIFLVFSYDQGYQSQIQNYMNNNFALTYSQDFSPNLEVREYKLRYN